MQGWRYELLEASYFHRNGCMVQNGARLYIIIDPPCWKFQHQSCQTALPAADRDVSRRTRWTWTRCTFDPLRQGALSFACEPGNVLWHTSHNMIVAAFTGTYIQWVAFNGSTCVSGAYCERSHMKSRKRNRKNHTVAKQRKKTKFQHIERNLYNKLAHGFIWKIRTIDCIRGLRALFVLMNYYLQTGWPSLVFPWMKIPLSSLISGWILLSL